MKLKYALSKTYREKMFVETGSVLPEKQYVELPADALTPALRAHLVRVTGRVELPEAIELSTYQPGAGLERVERPAGYGVGCITLDAPASDDDALRLLTEDAARYDAALIELDAARDARLAEVERAITQSRAALAALTPEQAWRAPHLMPRVSTSFGGTRRQSVIAVPHWPDRPAYARVVAADDALVAEAEALRTAVDAHARAVAEAEAAEKERRDAERREWITLHGSAYLRKCLAGGYDCQRRYVIERAGVEFPGYVVDYNDVAAWKDRAGPSEAALDEATRVSGTVVWLTAMPSSAVPNRDDDEYGDNDFEPCEAVVVRGFLGKYDLVRF